MKQLFIQVANATMPSARIKSDIIRFSRNDHIFTVSGKFTTPNRMGINATHTLKLVREYDEDFIGLPRVLSNRHTWRPLVLPLKIA